MKVAGLERGGCRGKVDFGGRRPSGGGTWLGRRFFGYYRWGGRWVKPSVLVGPFIFLLAWGLSDRGRAWQRVGGMAVAGPVSGMATNGTPLLDVAHHEVWLCPGSEEMDVVGPGMLCAHSGAVGGGESGLGQEASDAFCWREDVGRWRSVRRFASPPLVIGAR